MRDRPKLLRVLDGEVVEPPPIWIMRQAGRYLPEYRETRKKAGSFLDLCYTPALAAEVTLQPVRRFGFDAAILFSDILVIPDALGQRVRFEEGRGPLLEPLPAALPERDPVHAVERLAPVMETVRQVRASLDPDKALIGFCGAPWTVATYMIAGHGTSDQAPARRLALTDPARLQRLMDILIEASAGYLIAQLEAGADAVKIFDSWAGVLDDNGFAKWAVAPVRAIVERVRSTVPRARIIAFPKGAGTRVGDYAAETGADCVAVDWTLPMPQARALVRGSTALQGNLDPLRVVVGGGALDEGVDAIRAAMRGRPHIFNLGHGITPDAPLEHVSQLVERVRMNG
jgi:uroporphyrinogen decarboxylase